METVTIKIILKVFSQLKREKKGYMHSYLSSSLVSHCTTSGERSIKSERVPVYVRLAQSVVIWRTVWLSSSMSPSWDYSQFKERILTSPMPWANSIRASTDMVGQPKTMRSSVHIQDLKPFRRHLLLPSWQVSFALKLELTCSCMRSRLNVWTLGVVFNLRNLLVCGLPIVDYFILYWK